MRRTLFAEGVASAIAFIAVAAPSCESPPDCDARTGTDVTDVRTQGGQDGTFEAPTVADSHTYDARGWLSNRYGNGTTYPFNIGNGNPGVDTCVRGGTVVGSQSANLTWRQMKAGYDGDALRLKGEGSMVIDGFRAHNVEDGVSPRGNSQARFYLHDVHLSYIRDDCIENDTLVPSYIEDSLFDGCFVGVSERNPNPPDAVIETTILDGVLMRLERMPYDLDATGDPPAAGSIIDGTGHGQLFKWSAQANRLHIKNSIFFVPGLSVNGTASMTFPAGTTATNSTLVWLGSGPYPVPAGMTLSTDINVWNNARNAWLTADG